MHNVTKKLAIPMAVKRRVAERDSYDGWPCCVYCGKPAPDETAWSNAHFVPRSQLGLGCEKNIVTLCPDCHRKYDQSTDRGKMQEYLREYLRYAYDDWEESDLKWKANAK